MDICIKREAIWILLIMMVLLIRICYIRLYLRDYKGSRGVVDLFREDQVDVQWMNICIYR